MLVYAERYMDEIQPEQQPSVLPVIPVQNNDSTPEIPIIPAAPDVIHNTTTAAMSEKVVSEQLVSTKKKIAYFLIGLLFNIIALIPIVVWLMTKVKENRKPRTLSYLAGTLIAILFWSVMPLIFQPSIQTAINNSYPELANIQSVLIQTYPNSVFGIEIEKNNSIAGDAAGTTLTTMIITVDQEKKVTEEDFIEMGTLVCNQLANDAILYDVITIRALKRKQFLFLSTNEYTTISATCQEWQDGLPAMPRL